MLDYLLHEPDAAALVLLLLFLGLSLGVCLRAQRARRPAASPEESAGEVGEKERTKLVTTWPYLVRLELLATLIGTLVLLWWAIVRPVPLGPEANPEVTPGVAKAPWFFVGIQELLQYFDAWLAGSVLPLIMVLGLAALPYLDPHLPEDGPHSWRRRPCFHAILASVFLIWLGLMIVGQFCRGENWLLQPVWRPFTPDEVEGPSLLSLAARLGLGRRIGFLCGAVCCLGPFLLLPLLWPRLRHRPAISRMGGIRYLLAGTFLLVFFGIVIKIVLSLLFEIRYFWVTPWFNI